MVLSTAARGKHWRGHRRWASAARTGVGGRPPPTSGGSATGYRPQNDLDVVPTEKLTAVPQARDIFAGFAVLSPLRFHFPPYAEYATAVGATLSP